MRIILSILATLVLGVNVAMAQAPTLRLVSSVDKNKGVILFRESVQVAVMVPVQVAYIENGVTRFKTVTQTQYRVEVHLVTMEMANSRVITPDGKQLPIEDVWKRVKANTVVAYSSAGTPGEAYLRALNAE